MGKDIIEYQKHNLRTFVREDLKDKEEELSLCRSCPGYRPEGKRPCYLAELVEKNQTQFAMITPLIECSMYKGDVARVVKVEKVAPKEEVTPEPKKTPVEPTIKKEEPTIVDVKVLNKDGTPIEETPKEKVKPEEKKE